MVLEPCSDVCWQILKFAISVEMIDLRTEVEFFKIESFSVEMTENDQKMVCKSQKSNFWNVSWV